MSGPQGVLTVGGTRRDQLIGAGIIGAGATAVQFYNNLSPREQELVRQIGQAVRDGGQAVYDVVFRPRSTLRGRQEPTAPPTPPAIEDVSSPPSGKRWRGSYPSRYRRGTGGFVYSRFLNTVSRRRRRYRK